MENSNLDPRIWAAIISSIISLIIAIISLISNQRTLKKVGEQNKNLEEFKSELAKELEKDKIEFQKSIDDNKIKMEIQSEELKENLNSLHLAIRDFQAIKSILRLILNSPPNHIDLNDIVGRFFQINEEFQKSYQTATSHLQKVENGIYHDAKNTVFSIKNYLLDIQKQKMKNNKLPDNFYKKIKKYREYFSEMQNLLRDIRFEKIRKII